MSTRALVGYITESGSVKNIYNHFDGYVDGGLGEWLYENITNTAQVAEIVANGDASSIPNDTYYHRDRGEDLNIRTDKDVEAYGENAGDYPYIYLWDGKEWLVRGSRSGWESIESLKVEA